MIIVDSVLVFLNAGVKNAGKNATKNILGFKGEGRMDFNNRAELHPCMTCEHGAIWTEQGKPAGNICKHPEVCKHRGLYYGRYHTRKRVPDWCPLNQKTGNNN